MLVLIAFLLALIPAVAIAYPLVRRAGRALLSDNETQDTELASRWETAIAGLKNTELEWAIGNLATEDREWLREQYMSDAALVLKEMELEEGEERAVIATVEREIKRIRVRAGGEAPDSGE